MTQDFPRFELEQVLRSDAADILAAREKARIMHHGKDIRTAGDEVEIAFRKVLRRKLPTLYYVGHGHIVDEKLHTSPQLDTIIANNSGTATLLQAENGSEYFPYEGVYAIGEVKSSYDKSKDYIRKFSETLVNIQTQLYREVSMPNPPPYQQPYSNPLFSFMFFADAGDFQLEQILDLYQKHPSSDLPNIVCFLNKGIIMNMVKQKKQPSWSPLTQVQSDTINLIPAYDRPTRGLEYHWVFTEHGTTDKSLATHFAILYYTLTEFTQRCHLTPPNLRKYLSNIFDTRTTTVIS